MNHKRIKHLKGIVIVSTSIAVLVIVALGIYKLNFFNLLKRTPQETSDTIKSIQKNTNKDTALKELQKLANTTTDKSDKSAYLTAAVDVAINYTDNYDSALSVAQSLEANEKTASSAAYLATAYDFKKDYKNAAVYYEIAAERCPKTSVNERSPYNDYMILKRQEEAKLNEK